jgi:integrase
MARVVLTDRLIMHAKATGAAQSDFFDEKEPGLALRVSMAGRKSWCFLYTRPSDGKRARITLGTYPAMTLAGARGMALEARARVQEGQDPKTLLTGQGAAGLTVAGLVDAYLTDPGRSGRRTAAEIARRLRKNVVPVIGAVRLGDLRRRDVRNVTDAVLHRGSPVEAARVFEDVRSMARWAVEKEFLDVDPMAGAKKPGGGAPRSRVLSDREIETLWNGLGIALAHSKSWQQIIRLCLVTAQRVGEVAGISRPEVDWNAREWRLPAARSKNKHPHVIPLSTLAIELFNEAFEDAKGSAFAFPHGNASLPAKSVSRAIYRANETSEAYPLGHFGIAPWSVHDLRRTALTGMAQLGVAPIVLGHVANHRTTTRAGVTLGVYNQYAYDREKRAALDLWAERLQAIIAGSPADVVPLKGRRA